MQISVIHNNSIQYLILKVQCNLSTLNQPFFLLASRGGKKNLIHRVKELASELFWSVAHADQRCT